MRIAPKGEYTISAFSDVNGNGLQDVGEPAGRYQGPMPITASGDGVVASLDFVIAAGGAAPDDSTPESGAPAAPRHSTQAGALAKLDAPAFSAENGRRGYWSPMDLHDLSEELPTNWERIPEVAQVAYEAHVALVDARKRLAALS